MQNVWWARVQCSVLVTVILLETVLFCCLEGGMIPHEYMQYGIKKETYSFELIYKYQVMEIIHILYFVKNL